MGEGTIGSPMILDLSPIHRMAGFCERSAILRIELGIPSAEVLDGHLLSHQMWMFQKGLIIPDEHISFKLGMGMPVVLISIKYWGDQEHSISYHDTLSHHNDLHERSG